MEIEVGDYVRTEWGIRKVKKITIEPEVDIGIAIMPEVTALWTSKSEYFEAKDIYKHSKNIIDLIEVGDYVNGLRVEYITNEAIFTSGLAHGILFEDIRTVVTKEQFASIEYKVEEDR